VVFVALCKGHKAPPTNKMTQGSNVHTQPSLLNSLFSGAAAGMAVDISLFPLDTLKTRLQSSQGFWKSGGFSRIYAGLGPAALGSAPNAAIFFVTYESTKVMAAKALDSERAVGDPRVHMLAASLGEVTACLVRVPVEIVKQRRQADARTTALSIVKTTVAQEGVRGFYRGYGTTVMREIPFSLIQFPLWEALKAGWGRYQGGVGVDPLQSAGCGALAGGVSAALTTPLDVAKTRIMLAHADSEIAKNPRTTFVLSKVYAENGLRGLFAGLTPRVMWISIGGFVFFGVYEKAKTLVPF